MDSATYEELERIIGATSQLKSDPIDTQDLDDFMAEQMSKSLKMVLVTSGGTCVPLEKGAVRYLDNFSTGLRGARSAEQFLLHGYSVILLKRDNAKFPFAEMLDLPIKLLSEAGYFYDIFCEFCPELDVRNSDYDKSSFMEMANRLFIVNFVTVNEYFWFLRHICKFCAVFEKQFLLYSAAAVSDYYIPLEKLPVDKIPSGQTELTLTFQPVPKALKFVLAKWCPQSFMVTFKLETDENLLAEKCHKAIASYQHHAVVGNILTTRHQKVQLFCPECDKISSFIFEVNSEDDETSLESKFVPFLVDKHSLFANSKT